MSRNKSEIAVDAPEKICNPSGWWMRCDSCGRTFVSVIYLVPLMCMDCHAYVDPISKGAVWGYEWKTVVYMRNLRANLDSQHRLLTEMRWDNAQESQEPR